MTDGGFVYRGYSRVPLGEFHQQGVTDAVAIFGKDFFDANGELKYAIVVEKCGLYMEDGVLCGPDYIGTTMVHKKGEEDKQIVLNFNEKWSVDELEEFVEQLYQSKYVEPSVC